MTYFSLVFYLVRFCWHWYRTRKVGLRLAVVLITAPDHTWPVASC